MKPLLLQQQILYCRNHKIFTSEFILREVKEKLTGKIKLPADTVGEIIDYLRGQAVLATPLIKVSGMSRDPDDDNIIALAVTVKADTTDPFFWIYVYCPHNYVIMGIFHLLAISVYHVE